MKKKYISPETLTTIVNCQSIIATSLELNESGLDSGSDVLIKRDRSSRGSYNVWNEDWSN